MIVGCYVLDLYCDGCDRNTHTGLTLPDQFTSETGNACRREAIRRGWVFDEDKAYCPTCSKKRKKRV
jgi:hypothetical protein